MGRLWDIFWSQNVRMGISKGAGTLPITFGPNDVALALKTACSLEDPSILRTLLSRLDPSEDEDLLVLTGENLEILEVLLEDPRITSVQVSKALVTSCYENDMLATKRLLSDGRIVPSFDGLFSLCVILTFKDDDALMGACLCGNMYIVAELLRAGADPSARNNAAIKLASSSGNDDLVSLLLEDERVDPHAAGNFALKYSWSDKVVNTFSRNKRVDLHFKDNLGNSLLHLACSHSNWDKAKILVNECELSIFDVNDEGKNAIDIAYSVARTPEDIEEFYLWCCYWPFWKLLRLIGREEKFPLDIIKHLMAFLHRLLWKPLPDFTQSKCETDNESEGMEGEGRTQY
eukprot:TRINITY_DN1793_c0_g1_i24.p1 TRINITY_DN1793_c0_g1~~TRINITY_DN1793_c0_g1_i24.p1  ORF type:complete len:346 (-),score=40.69 TRINITY_DN1793_c0_g1_i24:206-1243(-)